MSSFVGKTAIVTGGASGIGERVAEDIVAQGGNVVIGDVGGDLGKELSSRLGEAKATFIELDVSQGAGCKRPEPEELLPVLEKAWQVIS